MHNTLNNQSDYIRLWATCRSLRDFLARNSFASSPNSNIQFLKNFKLKAGSLGQVTETTEKHLQKAKSSIENWQW